MSFRENEVILNCQDLDIAEAQRVAARLVEFSDFKIFLKKLSSKAKENLLKALSETEES